MKTFSRKGVVFGEGRMKIALPVTAKEETELVSQTRECLQQRPDLIEWRIDHFLKKNGRQREGKLWLEEIPEDFFAAAEKMYSLCEACPLLLTFRTGKEGGELFLTEELYARLLTGLARKKLADLLDVEGYFFKAPEQAKALCDTIRQEGVGVIGSNHDFKKTPPKQEMLSKLYTMQEMGADIAKLAVMPNCRKDVLSLFEASMEADERLSIPVVTMSMGETGMISRLAGNVTGSCLTFASAGKASAPGQLPVRVVKEVLGEL